MAIGLVVRPTWRCMVVGMTELPEGLHGAHRRGRPAAGARQVPADGATQRRTADSVLAAGRGRSGTSASSCTPALPRRCWSAGPRAVLTSHTAAATVRVHRGRRQSDPCARRLPPKGAVRPRCGGSPGTLRRTGRRDGRWTTHPRARVRAHRTAVPGVATCRVGLYRPGARLHARRATWRAPRRAAAPDRHPSGSSGGGGVHRFCSTSPPASPSRRRRAGCCSDLFDAQLLGPGAAGADSGHQRP